MDVQLKYFVVMCTTYITVEDNQRETLSRSSRYKAFLEVQQRFNKT